MAVVTIPPVPQDITGSSLTAFYVLHLALNALQSPPTAQHALQVLLFWVIIVLDRALKCSTTNLESARPALVHATTVRHRQQRARAALQGNSSMDPYALLLPAQARPISLALHVLTAAQTVLTAHN